MADFEEPQAEPEPVDDIRSALDAAVAAHDAVEEKSPRATPEPTATESADKPDTRARGPDGKFIRAEGDEAPEPAAAPTEKPAETPVPTEPKPDAPATSKDAPQNWPEADKATFKALPAEAQDFLLRRHNEMTADYTRKTQQLADFRREYEPVHQMFAPHMDALRQRGLTPASTISAWYNVEKTLLSGGQGAVATIKGIVDGYKIDPAQLAAALGVRQQAAPQPQPGADGQMPAIESPTGSQPIQLPPEFLQRLNQVEAWRAQEEQRKQFEAQQSYAMRAADVTSQIEQFASAVDSAGQPLHPHFKDVEDHMTTLSLAAQARGEKPTLSELYEQAVWANPSTRARLQEAERAAATAQRAAEEKREAEARRAKAEQSRRAGSSVSGAPGSGSQAPGRPRSNGSVLDDLRAAAEEVEA